MRPKAHQLCDQRFKMRLGRNSGSTLRLGPNDRGPILQPSDPADQCRSRSCTCSIKRSFCHLVPPAHADNPNVHLKSQDRGLTPRAMRHTAARPPQQQHRPPSLIKISDPPSAMPRSSLAHTSPLSTPTPAARSSGMSPTSLIKISDPPSAFPAPSAKRCSRRTSLNIRSTISTSLTEICL